MTDPNHARTKIRTIRLTEYDDLKLAERAKRAGTTNISAYIRRCCLTGPEHEMPPFETIRDLRNEVISLGKAIMAMPGGPARDMALGKVEQALGRICELGKRRK